MPDLRVIRHPGPAQREVALAIGSFDGVHLGHVAMIERVKREAAARGLAAGVLTFEPLPRELFAAHAAPARLSTLSEKLARLSTLGLDLAFVEHFDHGYAALDPEAFAMRLKNFHGARWVMVGQDFRFGARRAGDAQALHALGSRLGFEVEVMSEVRDGEERISSSRVRGALAAGELDLAGRLLGRPYAICGRVVHGAKRGRTLGFPTANVRLGRAKPALHGVFAVRCFGAATRGLEGVASLGHNPAVRNGGPASLEAHLFDFQGDLYGRRLSIEFLRKLRDEAAFASLDELARQMKRDSDAARDFFRATGTR